MKRNKITNSIYKVQFMFLLCFLLALTATAQTATVNYIYTRTPRTKIATTTILDTKTSNKDSVKSEIDYFDGLGRALQTVQVRGSASGKDVIQPFAYDAYGREATKYLPYTLTPATPGIYQSTALDGGTGYASSSQYSFYQVTGQGYVNTPKPLAGISFEASPLDRMVELGAPGNDWQLGGGHTVRTEYGVNNQNAFISTPVTNNPGSRKVALYTAAINSNFTRTLTRVGNTATYNNSTLSLTITKDENWTSGADSCLGTTEEYKDLAGRVVLKRTYNLKNSAIEMLSTYYVYDNAGNLCFVLPPDANPDAAAAIGQTTLDNFCYQYRFDERNRPTQKKLPGKGWEYTVYNPLDKVVATQDSLQRVSGQWQFIKYDNFGRVVMTGIWAGTVGLSRSSLQTTVNATTTYWETTTGTGTGYTTVAWPTSATTPLTINYYDKYANIPSLPAAYSSPTGATTRTQGLLVGTKIAVLNTPANMLLTVHYYDALGRNIKTYSQHYLGGVSSSLNYDAVTSTYDFTNELTTTKREHYNTTHTSPALLTVNNIYLYDHEGRKLKTWEQIVNGTTTTTKTLLSKVDYNEISQVLTKHLHSTDSTNFQQNIGYTYNERGWLLTSSAPLFAMQLYYNTGTNKAYNGNIMYQYWGTPGSLTTNYTYLYDRLNRLMSGASSDHNIERGIAYDMQGNITNLSRVINNTLNDSLVYSYTGNRLVSVNDKSTSTSTNGLVAGTTNYGYDGNGNLLSNSNTVNTGQNKSYSYNILNLPQTVIIGGGTITYTYDAEGNKLRKQSPTLGNTDYIGGIQYSTTITGLPDFIQTEEGKAVPSGTTAYKYYYYLSDQLGNTRITFDSSTGTATTLQKDDYLPFGMEINRSVTSPKNEYLYNKKELQEELNQYDYGARFYDPVIARWNSVDPLAEKYRRWTDYNYGMDNPIRFIDPDGMKVELGRNEVADRDLNKSEIDEILKELQKKTDDKLGYNAKSKSIIILSKGKGKKGQGTALIRHLIEHKNTLTLDLSQETKGGKDYGMIGGATGATNTADKSNESNGIGTNTTTTIGYGHPIFVMDNNGNISKGMMSFGDIIDHELIHGLAMLNGEAAGSGTVIHVYPNIKGGQTTETINKEEAQTMYLGRPTSKNGYNYPTENGLRNEQGEKTRLNYLVQ